MQELLLDTAFTVSAGGVLLVLILAVDHFMRVRRRKQNSLVGSSRLSGATPQVEAINTGCGKDAL